MQVLSFRLIEPIELPSIPDALNRHLPQGVVGVSLAKPAATHFNAHWRARAKEYRYRLAHRPSERWRSSVWTVEADVSRLPEVLERMVGTRDFAAFHDPTSAVRQRTLLSATARTSDEVTELRFRGDGFGRFMVRFLVAAAVAVCRGQMTLAGLEEALRTAQRPPGLIRAPAEGLILWNVEYDSADDPFTEAERAEARGVPHVPPFVELSPL
jgi:tRNA pseudouridine38-40 synthase